MRDSFAATAPFAPLSACTLGVTSPHVPTWDKCDFGTSVQPRFALVDKPSHARVRVGGFREALPLGRRLQVSYRRTLSRAHVGRHAFRCPLPTEHSHGTRDAAHARTCGSYCSTYLAESWVARASKCKLSPAHARQMGGLRNASGVRATDYADLRT